MGTFIKSGHASVVVGGQFGSEAKGLVASYLAVNSLYRGHLICTTNAGAQAGHTTILDDGRKFVCFHLPTIGVLRPDSTIYINAGSIIDADLLYREIRDICSVTGEDVDHLRDRIVVHPNAAHITQHAKNVEAEGATTHLGSTQKGVGAALADKIMRHPWSTIGGLDPFGGMLKVMTLDLMELMDKNYAVTVEIPQGTGLSINASPFFPKCTSRDCWLVSGLNDAAIHPDYLNEVAMVVRTFPIRVGHISDKEGEIVGNSGPFYPDSVELGWDQLPGVTPERTTVTKRVRRIATWSWQQYRDALRLNRPSRVFLTFTNYMDERSVLTHLAAMQNVHREIFRHDIPIFTSGAANTGSVLQYNDQENLI